MADAASSNVVEDSKTRVESGGNAMYGDYKLTNTPPGNWSPGGIFLIDRFRRSDEPILSLPYTRSFGWLFNVCSWIVQLGGHVLLSTLETVTETSKQLDTKMQEEEGNGGSESEYETETESGSDEEEKVEVGKEIHLSTREQNILQLSYQNCFYHVVELTQIRNAELTVSHSFPELKSISEIGKRLW